MTTPASAMPKKILIVEDQSITHRAYGAALEPCVDAGLILLAAWDGADGLRTLRQHPDTDLVLLDLDMPVMNGLEFLDHLRTEESLARVPVILCSGTGDKGRIRRALELGASTFLQKPCTRAELFQAIVSVLRLDSLECWGTGL